MGCGSGTFAPSSLAEGGSRAHPASHSLLLPRIVSLLSKRHGCCGFFLTLFIDFYQKHEVEVR